MNAITTQEITVLSLPERAAVALGESANVAKLHDLVKLSSAILLVNSKPGRDEAHRAGMVLAKTRTTITASGKAARADATAFSKAVIAMEADLIAIIEPEESRVLALRDGWDAAEQAAKDARIAAEVARVAAIRGDIQAIYAIPTSCIGENSSMIYATIEALEATDTSPARFAEFAPDAARAAGETMDVITAMYHKALDGEAAAERAEAARLAEAAKLAADREELRLLQVAQAQQAAQFAEQKRLAKVEADRVAADQELMRQTNITTARLLSEEQAAHAAEVKRVADALSEQQAAADARDAAAAKQDSIDAAHGEGLAMAVEFDALITGMNEAFADQVEADHAAALIHNAWYDAETSRLFAAIPVVAIETVPALDWPHQVGRPELSILADAAGDEPATDAEIIAELLAALKLCVAQLAIIENMTHEEWAAMVGATDSIARAESRTS